MRKEETLDLIKKKIETLGDLPVFTASVNHIRKMSSDPDSDIMSLSQAVLKDANLSVKLLRLANSTYYNRGFGKIGVVSRAIILLGFDTVKNLSLTMKFIEGFQAEHPLVDMDKLLVRAYVTAGFVRELAMKLGVKDAEETYTCALLHQLGEVAVAYFLPDQYIEILELNKNEDSIPSENEAKILGATMANIGVELAESWDFSSKITSTMVASVPKITRQITKELELNKVLAHVSSSIVGSLYYGAPNQEGDFTSLMYDLSKATGLSTKLLETSLTKSFNQSCDLAKTYGLSLKKLMPVLQDSGDEQRDKFARMFSFNISSQEPNEFLPEEVAPLNHSKQRRDNSNKEEGEIDVTLQLQYIQDITSLITQSAKLNSVLVKVLEGIHSALGFKRVALCLLTPNRTQYIARIIIGDDQDSLKEFFTRPIKQDQDIFSKVILDGIDVAVTDINDPNWASLIPKEFHEIIGAQSFQLASLRSGMRPLGFIYGDIKGSKHPISTDQQVGYSQFIAQARLALQTCR